MRFRLSVFGGSLLNVEFDTDAVDDEDEPPTVFGFTGRCDGLELTADRDPLEAVE